ncbi:hypothetical protein IB236_17415 [Acidovorax sp. ACV02]|uniref:LamG-like jellyroll fold domain-containing protein n=1 Tax=Acidovorax sp. ACV02 TaxID=2769310 RepID=UPI00177B275E|nr:LamG-like jellyroll fold domain-containing protein [Acidovorax sp. ACV02]MBD9407127.1 hypothetical protein [Acidovorax sp. ACV02]
MAGDLYYPNVSLLLPGNGADGGTTFTDFSPTPKTVTRYGGITTETEQFLFGGSSILFDTSKYLGVPYGSDFALGTGDFALEARLRHTTLSGYQTLYDQGYVASGALLVQSGNGNGKWIVYIGGVAVATESGGTVAANQWYDITITRVGTAVTIRRNGVTVATGTSSASITSTANVFLGIGSGSNFLRAYSNDIRLTKGVARRTADFTPSSLPFPTSAVALSGYVEDATGAPAARVIRALREDTGALVGSVTSNGTTGLYSISTTYGGAHTLNAYPAAGENLPALTLRGVIPV